jgi:hypothetical protein
MLTLNLRVCRHALPKQKQGQFHKIIALYFELKFELKLDVDVDLDLDLN